MDRKTYHRLFHETIASEVIRLKHSIYATEDTLTNNNDRHRKIVPDGILRHCGVGSTASRTHSDVAVHHQRS